MNSPLQVKPPFDEPKRQPSLIPLISLLIGASALWFAWFRYSTIIVQPNTGWYQWVQTAAIAVIGVLCLLATVTFLFDRSSGRAMLKTGLSLIPLLLFTNLVVFIVRIIQNIMQGNTAFFFDRLLAAPYKILIIPMIVIVLILLGALSNLDKNKE